MVKVVAGIMQHPEEDRYLVGLRLGPTLKGCWEFPGGKLELNESEETALSREWQEEIGWDILVKEEVYYNEFNHPELGKFSLSVHLIDLIETGLLPQLNAHTQFAWMTFEEILNLPEEEVTPSLKPIVNTLI